MSDTVIKVENLGKKYILSHLADKREQLFSALLVNKAKRLVNRGGKLLSSPFAPHDTTLTDSEEEFWALREVSFDIKQGDRVGIIGRNGAGKSTLLKILSRITEPTRGRITIDGRVASLLEVGTGFHSELSGRENIYLNGAILGMSREEIRRKFDEIVAFAEVERFLDTPVKRYSSGMYVRLAFAVAAHLEPEILIVDEVLAVGDAQFQKKCLGKMEDVSTREGRTVLFVSHNMEAISTLCTKGIMLGGGEIVKQGDIYDVLTHYTALLAPESYSLESANRGGSGGIRIKNVRIHNRSGENATSVTAGEPVYLNLEANVDPLYQNGKKISVGFGIDTMEGYRLFTTVSSWVHADIITRGKNLSVRCHLPSIPFIPGKYLISASVLYQMDTLDSAVHCASLEIVETASFHTQRAKDHGYVDIPSRFEVEDM